MRITFTEHAPIESGFSAIFDDRIAPRLSELDETRQAILAVAKRHAAIALGVGAVLGLWLWSSGSGSDGLGELLATFLFPLAFAGVAAFLLWKRQARRWSGAVAETAMPDVCGFIGDLKYDYEAPKGFPVERMHELGVIPTCTHLDISDRLHGNHPNDPPIETESSK